MFSHFNRLGDYLRFTHWRFVHSERLNLLKLNGTTQYHNENEPVPAESNPAERFRKCGWRRKTVCHEIYYYLYHMLDRTKQHNKIVEWICKAAGDRWSIYKQTEPIGRDRLKPDIILIKGTEAVIIDVTCPFENGPVALNIARQNKIEKYTNLMNEMLSWHRFERVSIKPIFIGSLVSWEPLNEKFLKCRQLPSS